MADPQKRIRAALARYVGGRFETSASGGATGMIMFYDADGKLWFFGGCGDPEDSKAIVTTLNAMLEIMSATPRRVDPQQ